MGIIQKRADELKRGDVLTDGRMVVSTPRVSTEQASAFMHGEGESSIFEYFMPVDKILDVESPDLTPAQQRADELAAAGRLIVNQPTQGYLPAEMIVGIETMCALLDKIKPPEPPTLAEALEVVLSLKDAAKYGGWTDERAIQADALLDRARRTGLLK